MTYSDKLKDPRWQRKRLKIFERDKFTCRDCGAESKTLHVHHCHYEKGAPWDTEDRFLLTLCEDCHDTRQDLEDDAKRALGIILSRLAPDDGLEEFTKSICREATASGEDFGPRVLSEFDWDWATDMRWFSHAYDNPQFRSAYESVTGTKPKWRAAK